MLLFVADFSKQQEKILSSLLIFAPANPPQSSLCSRAWQMGAAEHPTPGAGGKFHLLLGLQDQGDLPPAFPGQEEGKKSD